MKKKQSPIADYFERPKLIAIISSDAEARKVDLAQIAMRIDQKFAWQPVWKTNGFEIFYLSSDGRRSLWVSVDPRMAHGQAIKGAYTLSRIESFYSSSVEIGVKIGLIPKKDFADQIIFGIHDIHKNILKSHCATLESIYKFGEKMLGPCRTIVAGAKSSFLVVRMLPNGRLSPKPEEVEHGG